MMQMKEEESKKTQWVTESAVHLVRISSDEHLGLLQDNNSMDFTWAYSSHVIPGRQHLKS